MFTEAASPLVRAALLPASCGNIPPPRCITRTQFLRAYQPGFLPGYIERDISQVQATLSKTFGPALGADSALLVAEIGLTHVHGMPTESENVLQSSNADPESRTTATSWGYRLAGELEFNNPIAAVNLFPFAQIGPWRERQHPASDRDVCGRQRHADSRRTPGVFAALGSEPRLHDPDRPKQPVSKSGFRRCLGQVFLLKLYRHEQENDSIRRLAPHR